MLWGIFRDKQMFKKFGVERKSECSEVVSVFPLQFDCLKSLVIVDFFES